MVQVRRTRTRETKPIDPKIPEHRLCGRLGTGLGRMVALLLCVAALPRGHAQPEEPSRPFLTSALRARIVTTDQQVLSRVHIWLETKSNLTNLRQGEAPHQLWTEPGEIDFTAIKRIELRQSWTQWIGSDARTMEYYRLGPVGSAAPPPPEWRRSYGDNPAWETVVPVRASPSSGWLNHAQACWSPDDALGRPAAGEFVFRQQFLLQDFAQIADAQLWIVGGVDYLELALNDRPIHIPAGERLELGQFEITSLLRPGENVIALRAAARNLPAVDRPSLAFHIRLGRISGKVAPTRRREDRATIMSRGGDSLHGRVAQLDGTGIEIDTPYGAYGLPWDLVRSVIWPGGLRPSEISGRKGWTGRIFGNLLPSRRRASPAPLGEGLPLTLVPEALSGIVMLSDGRLTRARVTGLKGDQFILSGEPSLEYAVDAEELLGIFPSRSGEELLRRPRTSIMDLYCQVRTVHGEAVTGVLRRISGRRIVLQSMGGEFLRFPVRAVVSLSFPSHALPSIGVPGGVHRSVLPGDKAGGRGAIAPKIALLPEPRGSARGSGRTSAQYSAMSTQVQEAAFLSGLESVILSQAELARPGGWSPRLYPVVVSVDPRGEYFHTLAEEGDAASALEKYVQRGGTLLLVSNGGALRTAVIGVPGGFIRKTLEDGLAQRLRLRTIEPDGAIPAGIMPFDRPPNQTAPLLIQKTR
ncbi:hypothetical protein IIC65_04805, partial [Candidatus Sumerlaeota bacterium]|nr:hypothetical protein [Candidatus Sumerlaeota bacterium]